MFEAIHSYAFRRYMDKIAHLPLPGNGCHPALLGIANCGINAGVAPEDIFRDLRNAIVPAPGIRHVPDQEIWDAIATAQRDAFPGYSSYAGQDASPKLILPKRSMENLQELRAAAIKAGGGTVNPLSPEFLKKSPITIPEDDLEAPLEGPLLLLRNLYRPEDQIFIGKQYDSKPGQIRSASEWISFFEKMQKMLEDKKKAARELELAKLGNMYPLICPNPLSGGARPTRNSDKMTYRGDNCVKDFRFIVAESDVYPLIMQGALIRSLCQWGLRLSALIFSGGKSCHAWFRCDGIDNLEAWNAEIKGKLFPILGELGFDKACSNASRLSRLPGVKRVVPINNFQKLLFLSSEGGVF